MGDFACSREDGYTVHCIAIINGLGEPSWDGVQLYLSDQVAEVDNDRDQFVFDIKQHINFDGHWLSCVTKVKNGK
eukprot:13036084-Ditylum_brightwellii.AAC.1